METTDKFTVRMGGVSYRATGVLDLVEIKGEPPPVKDIILEPLSEALKLRVGACNG